MARKIETTEIPVYETVGTHTTYRIQWFDAETFKVAEVFAQSESMKDSIVADLKEIGTENVKVDSYEIQTWVQVG